MYVSVVYRVSSAPPKSMPLWGQRAIYCLGRTHREIFSKSYSINPKSDCNYHAPIDLEPNGLPFGSIFNDDESKPISDFNYFPD